MDTTSLLNQIPDPSTYADPTAYAWGASPPADPNAGASSAPTGLQSLTDALFNGANTLVAAATASAVAGIVPHSGLPVAPVSGPYYGAGAGFSMSSLLPILLIAGVGFAAVKLLKK